jgi:methyl-accepting chemotaxis protein
MSSIETDVKPTLEEESRRHAARNDYDRQEAATIERDIDATRADVRATLAALERRLSLDRLIEMTIGRIRERGGEFAGNLTDTATQNPVPVLLTSIGLGWMMLTSRRGNGNGSVRQPSRARERVGAAMDGVGERFHEASTRMHETGERLHDAGARLHDAVDSSRETLGETAESMRASASRAAAATREQVDYARERMDRLLHEQPLMLGALGLAAGALIGALLPTTEAEDRFIGDVRDKAVKNVARTSRTAFEAAKEHAASYSAPGGRDEDGERPSRPH